MVISKALLIVCIFKYELCPPSLQSKTFKIASCYYHSLTEEPSSRSPEMQL